MSAPDVRPPAAADDTPAAARDGWVRARRAQVERTIRRTREQIESRRETSTTVAVAYEAFGRDVESGGTVLAAALGFRIFLFFVPYVFFATFAFGFGADAADQDTRELARRSGIGGIATQAVANAGDLSLWTRIVTLTITGYATYAGARGIVKVLRIVHGLVWRVPVPRVKKSWRGALAFILVVTAAFALAFVIGALTDRFLLGGVITLLIYALVPFLLWVYVSWLLPHAECEIWSMVPGAAFFGIGVALLHAVTVIWIPHLVASRSDTYGAIGIALVILFWSYLAGRVMAMAAVLNAALYYRDVASGRSTLPVRDLVVRAAARLPFGRRTDDERG